MIWKNCTATKILENVFKLTLNELSNIGGHSVGSIENIVIVLVFEPQSSLRRNSTENTNCKIYGTDF